MIKNKKSQLTYEEIAEMQQTSSLKIHQTVKIAYNKMVEFYMVKYRVSILEAVLTIREMFNIPEKEAFDKLSDDNKEKIEAYVRSSEYRMGER